MAARPQLDAHRPPSPTPDRLHAAHRLDPLELGTDLLQALKVVCQALCRPQGYIDSVVRPPLKKAFATEALKGVVSK